MRRRASALVCACAAAAAVQGLSGCQGATAPAAPVHPLEQAPAAPAAREAAPAAASVALPVAAPAAPEPAALASDAPDEPAAASEASLRRQLANDSDPTEVALDLAARLCESERVGEALPVLDAALARNASPRLRIARAGVLRDLGQRHLARSELQAVRLACGAENLHPGLLFELAELQWLEGDGIGAAATLHEIGAVHASDPWSVAHRRERESLAAEIEHGGVPSKIRVRDLLGNLRGAPLATERLAVMHQLWNTTAVTGAARAALRERVVAIALGDDAAAVRAKGAQLATPDAADAEAFVRAALGDEAPLVRQVAAGRSFELLGSAAPAVLLEFLAKEQDPGVFLALHDGLATATRVVDSVLPVSVASAEGRAAVVARWRERVRP